MQGNLRKTTLNKRKSGQYKKNTLALSPKAKCTDCSVADNQRCWCQILRLEGCLVVSAAGPTAVDICFLDQSIYFS
jgi:hypothetical protein